jgi:anti-sigma B factor antagonist
MGIINDRFVSNNIVVVELPPEIDVYTAHHVRNHLRNLIHSGYVNLVLDYRNVQFFDSTGLGVPVGTLKYVRTKGGIAVIAAPGERIKKILRITGLAKVFFIFDEVEQAVSSLSSGILGEFPARGLQQEAPETGSHWFPGRVYPSDENAGEAVEEGLNAIFEAFGIEAVFDFPPQHSSWFREFLLRMKDSTARPTRDEVLDLLQRALEQQALDKPQAQIDIAQSQAVALLLSGLDKTPKGIVQVGSLLLIKVPETVYIRNLTQREMLHWERNPALFRDPERALQELQRAGVEEDAGVEDYEDEGDAEAS